MKKESPSCYRNQEPILEILKQYIAEDYGGQFVEFGSGTGQHSAFFSNYFTQMSWQPTDLKTNHDSINEWMKESSNQKVLEPVEIDFSNALEQDLPDKGDFLFTANTLHIVSPKLVENFFLIAKKMAKPGGRLFIYGPLNYEGKYTSESNTNFDVWLKNEVSNESAIRDFEWIHQLASDQAFKLLKDHQMPANNRLLVFVAED